MKRIIFTLLFCMITTVLPATTFARTGDIIGYAKYTDISAYINHYPITSYNINDYTAVIAEDLRNYGFNVIWNGNDRSLSITRNNNANEITPYGTIYKYSEKAGQNSFPYLETDIVTYINGQKVDSFNINGQTCVYIDDLAPYGEVVWVPEIRAIKMWISDLPTTEYVPLADDPASFLPDNVKFYHGTDIPTFDSFSKAKFTGINSIDGYQYKITNYEQFTSYCDVLEKLGYAAYDWKFREKDKVSNKGTVISVPYSQTYYYAKGNPYASNVPKFSIIYFSQSDEVVVYLK